MRIIVENSAWRNIGNAFFQTPLWWLMRSLFPEAEVSMGNGPVRTMFRGGTFVRGNILEIMNWQRADLHVLSGPILRDLERKYGELIEGIVNRGEQYALISASGAGATREERKRIVEFIGRYPPLAISTRDSETYEIVKHCSTNVYDGICAGFLVRHLPVAEIDASRPYFVSSFYSRPEPEYRMRAGGRGIEDLDIIPRPSLPGLPWRIAKNLEWLRPYPREVGGHVVVRPVHRVAYPFGHLNFSAPNSFMSHNPLAYLAVYKAAQFVVSDRVHACVVALGFGKRARLVLSDPRAGVFERLGLDPRKHMSVGLETLELEEERLRGFLADALRVNRVGIRSGSRWGSHTRV